MKYYTLETLERIYRRECPQLTDDEVRGKAKELHRALNTLDISWKRSNRRFYGNIELIGI
ncbi:MAG: hypothetical protein P4N59_10045 [Negativicutes bacterium]|nr:hypothetical protein [Negativicutes bacterium]